MGAAHKLVKHLPHALIPQEQDLLVTHVQLGRMLGLKVCHGRIRWKEALLAWRQLTQRGLGLEGTDCLTVSSCTSAAD